MKKNKKNKKKKKTGLIIYEKIIDENN